MLVFHTRTYLSSYNSLRRSIRKKIDSEIDEIAAKFTEAISIEDINFRIFLEEFPDDFSAILEQEYGTSFVYSVDVENNYSLLFIYKLDTIYFIYIVERKNSFL